MSLRDKIVSCVLTLALLLSAVTLPIHATVIDSEYRVTDASAVETDLNYLYVDGEKYSAGNYPRNTADTYLYIMQFLEVGYNGLRFDLLRRHGN